MEDEISELQVRVQRLEEAILAIVLAEPLGIDHNGLLTAHPTLRDAQRLTVQETVR